MLTSNAPAAPLDSLRAAGLATAAAVALLAAALTGARGLERHYLPALTPELSHSMFGPGDRDVTEEQSAHPKRQPRELVERLKNQGLALSRAALEQPDLLPLYGSSELLKGIDDKASIFFRHYPTGFAVFPVGRPGSTSLILAQKIGALGRPPRARKIAVSLSPSWFYAGIDPKAYAGNFSERQALAVALNPHLSYALKGELARRMEAFPETLAGHGQLAFFLARLARGTPASHALYALALPLGLVTEECESAQEHLETASALWAGRTLWSAAPERRPERIEWPRRLEEESQRSLPFMIKPGQEMSYGGSTGYLASLRYNAEWTDFDLLLRLLRELHYDPLLLSMPSNGTYMEGRGVSREVLAAYPRRLHVLAGRYGFTERTFAEHLEDPTFVVDAHDHLSFKGWMYYNRALDEFFHTPPQRP